MPGKIETGYIHCYNCYQILPFTHSFKFEMCDSAHRKEAPEIHHQRGDSKGPYPHGDFGVIGDTIGRQWLIVPPIVPPITLWVWPIYWATGQLIAGGSLGDCRLISSMFDISPPGDVHPPAISCPRREQPNGYGP